MMLYFYRRLKSLYKYYIFSRKSHFGKNFKVYPQSNCYSDQKNNIHIGDNCDISGIIYSMDNGKITIGRNTVIHSNSFIGSINNIHIGNYVIISNNVKIYDNNNHPTDPDIRRQMCIDGFYGDPWRWTYSDNAPVIIEDNVWIGERSTILKGVHVGQGSIIACNSVVTKNVPEYSIFAGNPAKLVKKLK